MIGVSEAAKRLRMTPQGIRDAIHRGTIAARRVVPSEGSALRSVFVIEEAEVERYRRKHRGKLGGTRLRATPEEKAVMARSGHMTMAEAAREVGVSPSHLTQLAMAGSLKSERRSILYIHEDEVARFKRERDEKIAALEENDATYWCRPGDDE